METTYTFRNLDASDAMRDHAGAKLEKLAKYLHKPANAHVIFNVERHHHICEITISGNGGRYVGLDKSTDMYASIDGAVDKIVNQLKKERERHKDHRAE